MDYSQFESVLGLASTALGTTGKAVATAEAIKSLFSGDKAPDPAKANALLNNLAAELTAANMMNVQMSSSLKALSQELKQYDEFEREKARYALFETPKGDMVYSLKEDMAEGQPIHFVCPVCMRRDRLISFVRGQGDHRTCQTNRDHLFHFSSTPIRDPNRNAGW